MLSSPILSVHLIVKSLCNLQYWVWLTRIQEFLKAWLLYLDIFLRFDQHGVICKVSNGMNVMIPTQQYTPWLKREIDYLKWPPPALKNHKQFSHQWRISNLKAEK